MDAGQCAPRRRIGRRAGRRGTRIRLLHVVSTATLDRRAGSDEVCPRSQSASRGQCVNAVRLIALMPRPEGSVNGVHSRAASTPEEITAEKRKEKGILLPGRSLVLLSPSMLFV